MPLLSPSHWEQQRPLAHFDLLVLGAGFVGLWTALHWLKRNPSHRVALVDPLPAGQAGASTRNAGFACFGSPTELLDDLRHEPEETIVARLHDRYAGLRQWRETFLPEELDWHEAPGHEVFTPSQTGSYHEAVDSLDQLNALAQRAGIPGVTYHVAKGISSALPHALSIAHEAGLHPGKAYACLTQALLQAGAHLHRGVALPPKTTWTKQANGWQIPSSSGTWTADHVVVASNAWAKECLPELDIVPGRGQVLLTAPIPNLPFQGTYHADAGYLYFRNVGDRLLLGGGRNQFRAEEETHSGNITSSVQDYLENYLREILLPGLPVSIEARWAGTMAFSSDGSKQAYVVNLGDQTYVAARMGGMGVALSPELGARMAAMIPS